MANGIGARRALAIGSVVAVIGIVGIALLRSAPGIPPVSTEPEQAAPPVAEVQTDRSNDIVDAEGTVTPPQTPAVPDPSGGVAPQLDVIRVDATGAAVVAGRGALGAQVILRLDGEEVASTQADDGGNFVSLFDVGVAEVPRVLTIESRDATGTVSRATQSIIVAPTFPAAPTTATAPMIASTSRPASSEASGSKDGDAEQAFEEDIPVALAPSVESDPRTPSETTGSRVTAPGPAIATDAPNIGQAAPASSVPDSPEGNAVAAVAVEAPRLFRAGPEGVSVIAASTAAPIVRQDLGIDAITYDAAGDVSLTGTGAQDSKLRIYLDNRPVQLARVDKEGAWTSPLPNVASGVYTLRIDAIAEDGSVESRIETPFQRTAPAVAAASRRDGITAITVQPGYTLWAISEGYFGEGIQYVQIFEQNRDQIRDPDLIFPGQVFSLPETE